MFFVHFTFDVFAAEVESTCETVSAEETANQIALAAPDHIDARVTISCPEPDAIRIVVTEGSLRRQRDASISRSDPGATRTVSAIATEMIRTLETPAEAPARTKRIELHVGVRAQTLDTLTLPQFGAEVGGRSCDACRFFFGTRIAIASGVIGSRQVKMRTTDLSVQPEFGVRLLAGKWDAQLVAGPRLGWLRFGPKNVASAKTSAANFFWRSIVIGGGLHRAYATDLKVGIDLNAGYTLGDLRAIDELDGDVVVDGMWFGSVVRVSFRL